MKKVKINTEYITLGQLLKFVGIIHNGAEAKNFVLENKITVNSEEENRRGRKLYPGYKVSVNGIEFLIEWVCFF